MWLDDEGVVHTVMNSDPFEEVPAVVSGALQRHLLVSEHEAALDRYQAVSALLDLWDEEFFEQLPEHLDELGTEPEDLGDSWDSLDDDEEGPDEGASRLPDDLVRALEEHVHAVPFRERLELLQHVHHIVSSWEELYLDHEKALGHLLLGHEAAADLRASGHEELLELHAGMHGKSGPGHGPEW